MQSIAAAEIVPLACILFKEVLDLKKYKSLIINTVHDSIVVDVHPDEIDVIPFELKKAMLKVPERLLAEFNLTLDVPMGVDLMIGDDWLDMEEIHDEQSEDVCEMEERTIPIQQTASV